MCARLDFYKQFTDKVPNSCSPPDNWLGKQRCDWRRKVPEKPEDPTSSQHNKNVFQLFHKITIYSAVGTDPFLFILKTQQKLNRETIIFFNFIGRSRIAVDDTQLSPIFLNSTTDVWLYLNAYLISYIFLCFCYFDFPMVCMFLWWSSPVHPVCLSTLHCFHLNCFEFGILRLLLCGHPGALLPRQGGRDDQTLSELTRTRRDISAIRIGRKCVLIFKLTHFQAKSKLFAILRFKCDVHMLSWGVSNEIWSNRGVSEIWSNRGVSDILIRFTNPVAAFKGGSGASFKIPPKVLHYLRFKYSWPSRQHLVPLPSSQ